MYFVALVVAFAAAALAWVATSQDQRDAGATTLASLRNSNGAMNRIWTAPLDGHENRDGFGGGITYAMDRKTLDALAAERHARVAGLPRPQHDAPTFVHL